MNSDKNVTRDNPASFKTEIPRAKTNIEGSVRFKAPLPPSMTAENVSESWPCRRFSAFLGGFVFLLDFYALSEEYFIGLDIQMSPHHLCHRDQSPAQLLPQGLHALPTSLGQSDRHVLPAK